MAHRYFADPSSGLVLFTDDGAFEYAEWEKTVLEMLADPDVRKPRRILADRRNLKSPITLGMLEQGEALVRSHLTELQDTRWAMLTNPGSSLDRSSDMIEDVARPVLVFRVFTDLTNGLRWLFPYYDEGELKALIDWVERTHLI